MDRTYKYIYLIISLLAFLFIPAISTQFGQNGDENVEVEYGKDIYNYWANGDEQALYYDGKNSSFGSSILDMHYYSGGIDFYTEAIHRAVPQWGIIDIRHVMTAIFSSLLIIFTGLLAYRLSGKNWLVAITAFFMLLLAPRLFGEGMNNGKDIPFATGFVMGIYFLVRMLQDFHVKKHLWLEAGLLALSWAIIFTMRGGGGLLFVAYVGFFTLLYFILNKEKRAVLFEKKNRLAKQLVVYLVLAFILGYIIGLLTWPFALESPISNVLASLEAMSNRQVFLRVLFDGKYFRSDALPWFYEFKWIFITTPIATIIAILAFLFVLPLYKKKVGWFPIILLLISALFPILYIIYKNSTVYDTWRHVFFVFPFWVVMGAVALGLISEQLKGKLKYLPYVLLFAGLVPVSVWMVKAHPYQAVYFNQIAGGVEGAAGNYDLDYYHISAKESTEWILKNAPPKPNGEKIKILSNMDGIDTYIRNDTNKFHQAYSRYYERGKADWDYFVTFARFMSLWQLQNEKLPTGDVVHEVKVDGTTIGWVLKRPDNYPYLANKALSEGKLEEAVALYAKRPLEQYFDENELADYGLALAKLNQIDSSIQVFERAILLDGERMDMYNILAQLYNAKGDVEKSKSMQSKAQLIQTRLINEQD